MLSGRSREHAVPPAGWILVRFHRGGTYRYDDTHPGPLHVMAMQRLADAGDGLNTYINQHVRDDYVRRIT